MDHKNKQKVQKKTNETTRVFRRMLLLMSVLGVACFAVLIGGLFYQQVIRGADYQARAVSQQTRNEVISAARGSIYDTNMKELAVSATVETVYISPVDIEDDEQAVTIARGLANLLDVDYDTIYKRTQKKNSYFEYVKRKIDADLADQVRTFITENELSKQVHLTEETKRYYPYGNLASHVIGFCGIDNQGLYGIELAMDQELEGTPGRIVSAKNGRGEDMINEYETYYEAQDGDSVVLTIDSVVQSYLEKYLKLASENADAQNGVFGIVMDVSDASVLAMGVYPDFDLNDPNTLDDETMEYINLLSGEEYNQAMTQARQKRWSNKNITDTYEPGSVFKIITGVSALEESVVTPDETFVCTSAGVTVYDRVIHCWNDNGHGVGTFNDGVKNSCNPVFVAISLRMGASNFFKYFTAFGFTEKTNIGLPGEAGGAKALYHSEETLSRIPVSLATSSFGQTFKVTPIQMITAVSAAVNGGTLYQPHVIKQVIAADGTVKESYSAEVVRQVVTAESSRNINTALEMVVSEGTGSNAYVKGYRVGGKTGTTVKTEIKDEFGESKLRIASFLGFAPADDPKIAVLIGIDEPNTTSTSGNMLAAPYVAHVLESTLEYLGEERKYTEEEFATLDVVIPDFSGMSADELQATMDDYSLTYKVIGDGDVVTDQMPIAGSTLPRDTELTIYMGGNKPSAKIGVPDIVGMTYSGIRRLLKDSDLYIRPEGLVDTSAKVLSVGQSIEPGEFVERGTVITITFLDNSNPDVA